MIADSGNPIPIPSFTALRIEEGPVGLWDIIIPGDRGDLGLRESDEVGVAGVRGEGESKAAEDGGDSKEREGRGPR